MRNENADIIAKDPRVRVFRVEKYVNYTTFSIFFGEKVDSIKIVKIKIDMLRPRPPDILLIGRKQRFRRNHSDPFC